MSAHPIEWHRECLKNSKEYLATQVARLKRMSAEVEAQIQRVEFAEQQIAHAEAKGMTAFDADRLLVKRKA